MKKIREMREENKYIIQTKEDVRRVRLIVYSILLVILIILSVICFRSFKTTEATDVSDSVQEKKEEEPKALSMEENQSVLDISSILKNNTKSPLKSSLITEEIDLDYITEYKDNPELPQGTMQVIQEGRDGLQEIIIVKKFEGEEFISEERISSKVTKNAVNKVVQIGTGSGVNNYNPKVGDSVYVTSDSVSVRKATNKKADILVTINKNEKVNIIEIENDWFKIKYNNYVGYAPANCFTNLNPNAIDLDNLAEGTEYSREDLISTLDFNMELNKPSGLTLAQFKKILSGNSGDTQGVLENNAEYFYYIERQYNINGVYIAAMAIHEGGWGTSKIANDKKNLFGYGAYDSNPYGGAYSFNTYAEGIDLVARMLVKYYLNPAGTIIYEGETASGSYYNGPTLSGVNTRYASDKNWANAVYKWMTYLYDRL
ncbi:MAG: G5 domain-containing protein [Clostridia bacterium]|nr:G5 domain-containing protein [Clostridia bacterium]